MKTVGSNHDIDIVRLQYYRRRVLVDDSASNEEEGCDPQTLNTKMKNWQDVSLSTKVGNILPLLSYPDQELSAYMTSYKRIVFINLNDIMLFEFLKPGDLPLHTFVFGWIQACPGFSYEYEFFYKRFPSFNCLNNAGSVSMISEMGNNSVNSMLAQCCIKMDSLLDKGVPFYIVTKDEAAFGRMQRTNDRLIRIIHPRRWQNGQ
ncbi:uncharacterized protein LOC131952838 isoform X2 [Physella acuta]|uniref:uncharacterized protein LOC131952838 isoform X2 n=1 Tax=Physella acuta TaxID=109671 RepID=UPI0027DBC229|nr:uncharacterized protein LOC131952838 isoform X2 [Physella acuta]